MNASETLRTAYEALWSRRMRSGLTVLGILIGIAAVTLTVGLGQGAQQQVLAQINSLGSNLLIVSPGSATSTTGFRGGAGSATTLTSVDAGLLADPSVAPDVSAVAPVSSGQLALVAGTNTWTTTVTGTTPDWLGVRDRSISEGRFITDADLTSANLVGVIGQTTAADLFGTRDPVGQTVTANGQTITIVGELATAGATVGVNNDDTLVVPRTTYVTKLSTSANPTAVSAIYVEGANQQDLTSAYQEINRALLISHDVTAATADFQVNSQEALLQTATNTTAILTVLLGGIAAISLMVGGIGVMNIMLVSVTERVHEIGLRKALGANPKVIRNQFLVEASLLGFVGGILGLTLGLGGGALLASYAALPIEPSPGAAAAALVVSLIIGVIAGVYPASRAAHLAPIDALRSE